MNGKKSILLFVVLVLAISLAIAFVCLAFSTAKNVRGAQGLYGPINTGTQGFRGVQGNIGTSGFQGLRGAQGQSNLGGSQGSNGSSGPQGVVGIFGLSGVQGDFGPQGSIGKSGPQGLGGFAGAQGNIGKVGFQGVQGYMGSFMPIVFSTGFQLNGQYVNYDNTGFVSLVAPLPVLKGSNVFSLPEFAGDTYQIYLNGILTQTNAQSTTASVSYQAVKNTTSVGNFTINMPIVNIGDTVVYNYNLRFDITTLDTSNTRLTFEMVCTTTSGPGTDFVRTATACFTHAALTPSSYIFQIQGQCQNAVGGNTNISMVQVA